MNNNEPSKLIAETLQEIQDQIDSLLARLVYLESELERLLKGNDKP